MAPIRGDNADGAVPLAFDCLDGGVQFDLYAFFQHKLFKRIDQGSRAAFGKPDTVGPLEMIDHAVNCRCIERITTDQKWLN